MMRRCPNCGSIWVCWNWLHYKRGSTVDIFYKDEFYEEGEADHDVWVHECHNCSDSYEDYVWDTEEEVRDGIPYWVLRIRDYIKYRILK